MYSSCEMAGTVPLEPHARANPYGVVVVAKSGRPFVNMVESSASRCRNVSSALAAASRSLALYSQAIPAAKNTTTQNRAIAITAKATGK